VRGYEYYADAAIAIALGLTSYVDSSGENYGTGIVCRAWEPRDALDRAILAFENDDLVSLEASLGPHAGAVLKEVFKRRFWAEFKAKPPGRKAEKRLIAMGYNFSTTGAWATLDENLASARASANPSSQTRDPQVDATFVDRSGHECSRQRILSSRLTTLFISRPGCVQDRQPKHRGSASRSLGMSRNKLGPAVNGLCSYLKAAT
jgi:hypothetical protein